MDMKPLCIIQARYGSTRLPGKMLFPLGGESLIARAWRIACEAFGESNCVVAIPASDADGDLGDHLIRMGAIWMRYKGEDADVLGRFHYVAHSFRWHPDSVIVRYTPDDPFKTVDGLRRVAAGERLPVEIGGEAFTLGMLDAQHKGQRKAKQRGVSMTQEQFDALNARVDSKREHITYALFDVAPPAAPAGQVWTVDTEADLIAARERWARERAYPVMPVSPFDGGSWSAC